MVNRIICIMTISCLAIFILIGATRGFGADDDAELKLLAGVKKIPFSPFVVLKADYSHDLSQSFTYKPSSPDSPSEHVMPTKMVVSIDSDCYFFVNDKLVRAKVTFEGMGITSFERMTAADSPTFMDIDPYAVFSAQKGKSPAITLLLNANNHGERMIAVYELGIGMSDPPVWKRFIRASDVYQGEELAKIDLCTWGQAFALCENDILISYRDKNSKTNKTVRINENSKIVSHVPSYIRDKKGYYYAESGNKLTTYSPAEKMVAEIGFASPPNIGCLTVAQWQAVDTGVWIQILLAGKKRAYIHYGPNGNPIEWFEIDYEELAKPTRKGMGSPYFSVDGRYFYYCAVEAKTTDKGDRDDSFVLCRVALK